jgi:hypothetical protein
MKTLILLVFCTNFIFAQNFSVLDQYLQNEVQVQKLVGVHGLVFHKNKVVYNKFYGNRDRENQVPMSGKEIYYLQSRRCQIVSLV